MTTIYLDGTLVRLLEEKRLTKEAIAAHFRVSSPRFLYSPLHFLDMGCSPFAAPPSRLDTRLKLLGEFDPEGGIARNAPGDVLRAGATPTELFSKGQLRPCLAWLRQGLLGRQPYRKEDADFRRALQLAPAVLHNLKGRELETYLDERYQAAGTESVFSLRVASILSDNTVKAAVDQEYQHIFLLWQELQRIGYGTLKPYAGHNLAWEDSLLDGPAHTLFATQATLFATANLQKSLLSQAVYALLGYQKKSGYFPLPPHQLVRKNVVKDTGRTVSES